MSYEISLSLHPSLQVILDFEYVPRYVRETGDVTNVSDDSALTPSSQPFSPITLGEDSAGSTHYNRLQNHALSEGYMTTESGVNNTPYSAEVRDILCLLGTDIQSCNTIGRIS